MSIFDFHAPKTLRRRKIVKTHGLYFISSFGSRFITWWQWRTSRRSSCIPDIQWVCFQADQKTQDLLLPTAWSFLTTRLKKTMTECLASASRCMTFPIFFLIHFHISFILINFIGIISTALYSVHSYLEKTSSLNFLRCLRLHKFRS